ncbi:MAG: sodium/glutamate symporter [Acidobacteriota bacterium]|nr:sodium/glutamate symporter [Acidobacteriota bacterium]MDW3229239.1 sodium/glutamate symporter [Acidobacteriota bacterium]MDY0231280.1 sodium/glutamate symporter [Candidatus Saccharicenans sp.]
MLKLDLIQTVAFAGIILFLGYGLRRWIKPLDRLNIPAPVIGGLLVSLIVLVFHQFQITPIQFDITLRDPLMIAFFTTIGFAASLSLLKVGGPQVLIFFLAATFIVICQNLLGLILALPLGLDPLMGVICGSATQTGGPATALAFGPVFEQAGVSAATTVAVAAAIFGIISGGLIGGPVGTFLVEKKKLKKIRAKELKVPEIEAEGVVEELLTKKREASAEDDEQKAFDLLKSVVIILVAMWVGSWISQWFVSLGITLPAYIGAMLVAAIIRNLDDVTGLLNLDQKVIDDLGHVALNLFLVIALMTLELWELAGLFLPMLVILAAQVAMVALVAQVVFRLMGKDYEAAVMSAGFCGFALGTTANAMANMKALVERYGRAPRAFLVVPIVGAFFIDFTNALIITVFLNLFK